MKTNFNNIWQKCSKQNFQQNYVEQVPDLFAEHRYLSLKMRFNFFLSTMIKH